VHERDRLGDLEKDVVVVREDGVVGADEPSFRELVRMDVDERRRAGAEGERDLADHATEPARTLVRDRVPEECDGIGEVGQLATNERLGRELPAAVDVDDRLKDDAQVLRLDDRLHRAKRRAHRVAAATTGRRRSLPAGYVSRRRWRAASARSGRSGWLRSRWIVGDRDRHRAFSRRSSTERQLLTYHPAFPPQKESGERFRSALHHAE
jgi:hypothetical protein